MAKKPSVNADSFVSAICLLASLLCMLAGFLHCRVNSYSYDFVCDRKSCTLSGTDHAKFTFPSADLIRADYAEILQTNKKVRTLKVFFNVPAEAGSRFKVKKEVLFTPYDMGEDNARAAYDTVQDFKRADTRGRESFNISKRKSTTPVGSVLMIVGAVATALSAVFGRWSKHKIDYNKKSY